MHLPTTLRHRVILLSPPPPRPPGASYISCTEYNGASSRTVRGRCVKKAVFKQWENLRRKSVAEARDRGSATDKYLSQEEEEEEEGGTVFFSHNHFDHSTAINFSERVPHKLGGGARIKGYFVRLYASSRTTPSPPSVIYSALLSYASFHV